MNKKTTVCNPLYILRIQHKQYLSGRYHRQRGTDKRRGQCAFGPSDDAIALLACQDHDDQHSQNKSSRASLGVSLDLLVNARIDVTASASRTKGHANEPDALWGNTHVSAGQNLTLISGGDTTLQGAMAQTYQISALVSGNQTHESCPVSYHSKWCECSISSSLQRPNF